LPAAVFPVAGEPTAELARTGAAAAREHGADVIAAIGGGSVIDLGKAVAMLLANGGEPLDYLEVVGSGQKITQARRALRGGAHHGRHRARRSPPTRCSPSPGTVSRRACAAR
jgi:Alcohol dehydrogenase, class IV